MKNLMNVVSDVVSGNVLDGLAGLIDSDRSTTSSAISKFAPAIIGGLIDKGGSLSGAKNMLDFFKSNNYGDNKLSGLASMLGNTERSAEYLNDGMGMLEYIFGNNFNGVLDKLVGLSGVDRAGGSTLLKFLAPVIMNKLAGLVSTNNWGANRLSEYLGGQKSHINSLVPGLASTLGFAYGKDEPVKRETRTTTTTTRNDDNSGGGGSWWKWLLPLLLLAALAYWLTKGGCDNSKTVEKDAKVETVVEDNKKMETEKVDVKTTTTTTTTTPEVVVDEKVDLKKLTFAANGDILDADGNIIVRNGQYAMDANGNIINNSGRIIIAAANIPSSIKTKLESHLGKYRGTKLSVDADGNLVDASGKIIYKKGDFVVKDGFYYDKEGNRLGRLWEGIKKAVAKTVDSMKNLFTDMFKKKPGVESTYLLTDIVFDKENHKITNFTKAEVEGLANALKANKDSKIEVMVYTNDGKDAKENKKLSKKRANVVYDMLTTLGVDKGQISFKGKGSEDAGKAAQDRVEIKVVG